jgi:AraC-like DNA-binding protein
MYEERASRLEGAVVWTKTAAGTVEEAAGAYPVLPDGCMDLLWMGGRLVVAGPDTRAHASGAPGSRCAGVRFAPGTAPALLGVPACELRDRRVELADLWSPAEVRRLTARLAAAPDPALALETVALDRAARAPAPDPLLRAVVAGLDAGHSVAATAGTVGLGARQLHRRSLDAFGYGPKTLARVLRLQRALAFVRAGLPYAEAATSAGCADQAHLARETRALAGLTPGAYAALAKSETSQPSGSRTTA